MRLAAKYIAFTSDFCQGFAFSLKQLYFFEQHCKDSEEGSAVLTKNIDVAISNSTSVHVADTALNHHQIIRSMTVVLAD